jgi:probable rRNA maturation factor
MQVELINRQRSYPIAGKDLAQFAESVLESLSLARAQVSVVFVSDRQMRRLNRDFRLIDKPTDVLSFSYRTGKLYGDGSESERAGLSISEDLDQTALDPDYLGDVVISTQTAAHYAERLGLTLDQELKRLILHGVLHLCGYDHETDNGEMNRLEQKLRRRLLGKKAGLIDAKAGSRR